MKGCSDEQGVVPIAATRYRRAVIDDDRIQMSVIGIVVPAAGLDLNALAELSALRMFRLLNGGEAQVGGAELGAPLQDVNA